MNNFYSSYNNRLGSVQSNVFSGMIASMPLTKTTLSLMASRVDLVSGEAEIQTIRKLNKLPVSSLSLSPINRNLLSDSRISTVTGSTIILKPELFANALVIDNVYASNTKENIMSTSLSLLANWGARVEENLIFNMLKSAGQNYIYVNGGTTNANSFNEKDAIISKGILDANNVARCFSRLATASTNISTYPAGEAFCLHISTDARSAVELAFSDPSISPNSIIRPYELGIATNPYSYSNLFFIKKADTNVYVSTEMKDTSTNRIGILHGEESFVSNSSAPFQNMVSVDTNPAISANNINTLVSYRKTIASAVVRNERIVVANFSD